MIGAVSFSGSAVAFGKLQGLIDARAFRYSGQQLVTGGLFAGMILGALALIASAAGLVTVPTVLVLALVALLALAFGVALVMPIGGADMPVVISLLNAYTGLAVAMAGFSIGNQMLIIAGTLVGASGTLLTRLMSKAMNRSLGNELFGMEQINDDFKRADVALVIGANDVTNPAARSDKSSPIYGMPILNVDQAQNIIVIKRSMKPGFAGIDNDLYLDPKTGMLFGDAKQAVSQVVAELKKAA